MASVTELPHDILSEKSLLGCLLIDGQAIDEISNLGINKKDFYHPQFGEIFDVISELYVKNDPIDFITVCSKLTDRGKLESMGGQSFVLEIIEDQASSANVIHYAKQVKDKASLRELIRTANRVIEQGMNFSGDYNEFLQGVEGQFFKLTNEAKKGDMKRLSACLKDNLKELEAPGRKPGELSGLSTGYKELDTVLLGMQPGQLIIVAARPGMGKTSFALNLAINSMKVSRLPVAVFSLEMLAPELSMKILSSEAKVDSTRLRSKNFLDTDLRNIAKTIPVLSELPLYINDQGSSTALDILSQCRKIKSEHGLGMIMIDYIQLMKPINANIAREQQISEISRTLKQMAKELECPVVALSQLNRGVESRTDKRPMLSDLRESGSIEQDADTVMLIYRDDYYNQESKEKGVAEIIVAKNRAGVQGTVKLSWVGAYTTFGNLESYREPPVHAGA